MPTHRSPGTVLAALLGGGSIALAAALPAGQAHAQATPRATAKAPAAAPRVTAEAPAAAPRVTAEAPAAAPRTGDLAADLDAILADARLTGAGVGVLVRDARTGRVRYDRRSGVPLMPASNQKIHTSTAALSILGPGYRFRTSVRADARAGSTVHGNLYLKGTGDPTLRAAEYDRLAAEVAARGVTEVTGDLVADDTWFDAERTAPGWDPADFPYAYAAQISALTIAPDDAFNAGSIKVTVTPGEAGGPVRVALDPPVDVVTVDNRATTGAAGTPSTLSVTRPRGANTIVVSGSYPAGGKPVESLRTVEEPALYAAAVFRDALEAHGVRVAGTTRRGRTPAGRAALATRRSMPLSALTTPFLKLSNNVIAEILVKAIGRETRGEGSWRAGLPVIERHLASQGVSPGRLELTDGSGLSRSNRTTPRDIAAVLGKARGRTWFPAWFRALPVAGDPDPMTGGTLSGRMGGTPAAGRVQAKTGTLTGVTALSGYVRDPSGHRLIFSVVLNGYSGGAPKDIEDRIAVRLAGGPAALGRSATARQVPGPSLECTWTMTC